MTSNFAKLPEQSCNLSTMPGAFIRRRRWPRLPDRGAALELAVEKEATIQMASFYCCQSSLTTTLMTILDS